MEETVLLHFEVDQAQAEKDLIKVNKAILNNKEARQELTKAYKQGTITQEEYVTENIRLQQNIKKEQTQVQTITKLINIESNSRNALKAKVSALTKEYDNLNTKTEQGAKRAEHLEKELAQLNAQLTKGNKAAGLFKNEIGNYPDKFREAAAGINVAGTSVGDIGAKLASFANPATAAVGIVAALGAAYARSTIGAKDLEFAQNTLSAAITLTTNKFAALISSSEDGQGAMSKATDYLIGAFLGIDTLVTSKLSAFNLEQLEDLQREELALRDKINDRLETNQELMTEIQTEQTIFNDKIHDADLIIDNLRKNESELLEIKKQELGIVQSQLALDKDNEATQTSLLEKQLEISRIEKDTEKQVQKILRLKENLETANAKELEAERLKLKVFKAQAEEFIRVRDEAADAKLNDNPFREPKEVSELRTTDGTALDVDVRLKEEKQWNAHLKELYGERAYIYIADTKEQEKQAAIKKRIQEAELDVTSGILGAASSLFDEQSAEFKVLATAQTLISTYSTAQKAYEAAFVPPTIASPAVGALYASLAVANGLANVAQINGVQFAEGGFTGPGGKYEAAGIVHKGEYVVPQKVNYNPAAQPHLRALESMRTRGYADGGFVTNQSVAQINNSMLAANMFKKMPPIYASWAEGKKIGRQLEFKENISSI